MSALFDNLNGNLMMQQVLELQPLKLPSGHVIYGMALSLYRAPVTEFAVC